MNKRINSLKSTFVALAMLVVMLGMTSCEEKVERSYGFESDLIQIKAEGNGYKMYLEGKPFYIKGVAGREHLDSLVKAGGNCVRTWSTAGLDTLLDAAHKRGLKVMVGLDVTPGRLGLDYTNEEMLKTQRELVRKSVRKYKDHPALLLWSVGNELDLSYEEKALYPEINKLAKMVKAIDPRHPVSVSVGVQPYWINGVATHCPDIDLLAINIFQRLPTIRKRFSEEFLWKGPYIFSEWSNRGFWEGGYTDWDAPVEDDSFEKGRQFFDYYNKGVKGNELCLGAFAFYWGNKQERTHTWFSMFSENGEKNSRYDAVYHHWNDVWPSNRAPDIKNLSLNGLPPHKSVYLDEGKPYTATFESFDPEDDSLRIDWEVLTEGNYRAIYGGDKEGKPEKIEGLDGKLEQNKLSFQAPLKSGAYRLFIYAHDKKGSFGAANIPFFVEETELVKDLANN
ncbi:MAG: hypothetical protein MRZ79_24540 [Bacteroidia bacterium]|nr:hypothetical protein [Bacteroidia bacterium]